METEIGDEIQGGEAFCALNTKTHMPGTLCRNDCSSLIVACQAPAEHDQGRNLAEFLAVLCPLVFNVRFS